MLKMFLRKTKIIALAAAVTFLAASFPTPAATLQNKSGIFMEEIADDVEKVEEIEDGQIFNVASISNLPLTEDYVVVEENVETPISENKLQVNQTLKGQVQNCVNNMSELLRIANSNDNVSLTSFDQECSRYVKAQMVWHGIASWTDTPNSMGYSWVNKVIDGAKTSKGYYAHKITGNNCLDTLLDTVSQPIYNVVISYGNSSPGHVVFVYAIEDNIVYFTDNWGYSNGSYPKFTALTMSVSEFKTFEKNNGTTNALAYYSNSSSGNVTPPSISKVETWVIDSCQYQVSAYVTPGTYPISEVRFPTWTEANGQDDLAHGQENIPENWEKGIYNSNGGYWYCRIYDYDHNFEKGKYITHIYAFDTKGNMSSGANTSVSATLENKGERVDEMPWNGHTYYLIADNLTWPQAKAACEKAGGHLATITSREEQEAVEGLMENCDYDARAIFYLGGKVVNKQVQWITGETSAYTNWKTGQPDNNNNAEDCLSIYNGQNVNGIYGSLGTWNDAESDFNFCGYILEIDPAATIITTQPSSQTVKVGNTAKFTVKANGYNLSYQWQESSNGSTWTNSSLSGNKSDTLSVVATANLNGRKYRCVVTGANGTVTSNAVTLTLAAEATKITVQPTSNTATPGDIAIFYIKALGENLTYQWQVSKDGTTWSNSVLEENKKAAIGVKASASNHLDKYRCIVTGNGGSVISNVVTLTVSADMPELKAIFSSHDGVNFVWNPVKGITKYRVYRKTGTGAFIKLLDTTDRAILDKSVSSGTKYTYTVECLSDNNKTMSGKDEAGKTITYLDTPVVNVPTNAAAGVRVSWPTVKGAAKYVILRSVGPGQPTWKWLKTVAAGTSATQVYVDTSSDIKSGTWYAYTIRAMAADDSYSGQVGGRAIRWLAPVQTKSIVRANPGVKVYFNNVPGGYAYCLYRSEKGSDGEFGEYVKIKQTIKAYNGKIETGWIPDTTAKKGKTYRYYVRCVRSTDGVPFSSFKNYLEIKY